MQNAAKRYFQTQVTTTSQGEIVVMLYDGAIKFLNKAKQRLDANDMAGKGIAISKALDVINELDSSLNREKGGTLAENLHGLYVFCSNHLVKANLKKSQEMIDDVLRVLTGLRSAYAEIASLPEAQAAAQEAAENLSPTAIMPPRASAGVPSAPPPTRANPAASARMRSMYSAQSAQSSPPSQASLEPSMPSEEKAEENSEPSSTTAPAAGNGFGQAAAYATRMGARMYLNFGE